jgi:hypothetical protein
MQKADVTTHLPAPVLLTLEEANRVAAAGSPVIVVKPGHPLWPGLGDWWYLGKPPFTI